MSDNYYGTNTDITFSSVEDAVNRIDKSRQAMEDELEHFANAVRTLIANHDFVGTAADSFEESFQKLKQEKFDAYLSLIKDFSRVLTKGKEATQDTAAAAEADATANLYR